MINSFIESRRHSLELERYYREKDKELDIERFFEDMKDGSSKYAPKRVKNIKLPNNYLVS